MLTHNTDTVYKGKEYFNDRQLVFMKAIPLVQSHKHFVVKLSCFFAFFPAFSTVFL